jgi:ribosome maturation factor RimP
MKGTMTFPSSFNMTQDIHIQAVEKLLGPLLQDDIFLVSIKIKPINNIKIYLDADSGLGIEKCIRINRALYKIMEEMGMYPEGDFSLEVSSPGVDEPLKLLRQYKKNIGRNVEVTSNDDTKQEGTLVAVAENAITIEYSEGKGKKALTKQAEISFTDIKQTKVQVKF